MRPSRLCLMLMLGVLLFTACSAAGIEKQAVNIGQIELPGFVRSAPVSVQQAYQFAITHQHDLEKYPCYCGCGRMGHKSNLNCYIKEVSSQGKITFDNHAVGCGICVDITKDVMRMMQDGKSAPVIRAYIDAQYSQYGPPTDTALPTE
jgi:hypothetical protein